MKKILYLQLLLLGLCSISQVTSYTTSYYYSPNTINYTVYTPPVYYPPINYYYPYQMPLYSPYFYDDLEYEYNNPPKKGLLVTALLLLTLGLACIIASDC